MKLIAPFPKWIWNHAIAIALVSVLAVWVSGAQNFWDGCKSIGFAFIFTAVLWTANMSSLYVVRKRLPGISNTGKRIAIQIIGAVLLAAFVASSLETTIQRVVMGHWASQKDIFSAIRTSLTVSFLVMTVVEANYLFQQWKAATEQANALQEANLRAQLGRLKSELNPHFLFNNFNTLAAVIEEDPKKATRMVEALSKYYRYVLKGERHALSTLADELESLEAYAFLLKIRFEDAFVLDIDIAYACLVMQLPTLTLQTLAENATKHNAPSASQPLRLVVSCDEKGILIISNNLRPRHSQAQGAGVGLANLQERGRLLGLGPISITQSETHFTLAVPMLAPETVLTLVV